MTTAGKWMFIVGLVLSLIAAVAVFWGIRSIASYAASIENESTAMSGGTATVQMESGEVRLVLAESGEFPSCTVTLPDGTQTPLDGSDEFAGTVEGADVQMVGAHTATVSGEHTFTCEGTAQTSLTPPFSMSMVVALLAATLGFLALLPLGLLTVVGLILWLVGRNKDNKARQNPVGPGGPYGYQQGGYGQGGYEPGYQGQNYPQASDYGGQNYPQQGGYGQGSSQGGYGQSSQDPYAAPPPDGRGEPPRDEDRR